MNPIQQPIYIVPIAEEHTESYHGCVDGVALTDVHYTVPGPADLEPVVIPRDEPMRINRK